MVVTIMACGLLFFTGDKAAAYADDADTEPVVKELLLFTQPSTATHVTSDQGEVASVPGGVRVRFGKVTPSFSVELGGADIRGWDRIEIDTHLTGPPTVWTMRAADKDGKTYTSWYQLTGTGDSIMEYDARGIADSIDVRKVQSLHFRCDDRYKQLLSVPAAAKPVAAEILLRQVRLARGKRKFTYLSRQAVVARPVRKTQGNAVANGSFELGLQGWGSWGQWDGGRYTFGTGKGADAWDGVASAAIHCRKKGRGGIHIQLSTLAPGKHTMRFYAKGSPGARMFWQMERADGVRGNGWRRFDVPRQWKEYRSDFHVTLACSPRLYFYHIGEGSLYIDAVSITAEAGGESEPRKQRVGQPAKVEVVGNKVLVNGKPFFPLGWYEAKPGDLAGGPFNTIFSVDANKELLDACGKAGLLLNCALTGMMRGHRPQAVETVATDLKDHPALLTWYICDEPDHGEWNVPPREVAYAGDLLKKADTNHPTSAVMMSWAESTFWQYASTVDIPMTDLYKPDAYYIAQRTRLLARAAAGKPVWIVLESTYGKRRELSRDEINTFAFAAIASGARGLAWFAYAQTEKRPAVLSAVEDVAHAVTQNMDILAGGDDLPCETNGKRPAGVEAEIETLQIEKTQAVKRKEYERAAELKKQIERLRRKNVIARALKLNNELLIVLVNTGQTPVRASVKIPGLSLPVEKMGESYPNAKVAGDTIIEELDGLTHRIYRIPLT